MVLFPVHVRTSLPTACLSNTFEVLLLSGGKPPGTPLSASWRVGLAQFIARNVYCIGLLYHIPTSIAPFIHSYNHYKCFSKFGTTFVTQVYCSWVTVAYSHDLHCTLYQFIQSLQMFEQVWDNFRHAGILYRVTVSYSHDPIWPIWCFVRDYLSKFARLWSFGSYLIFRDPNDLNSWGGRCTWLRPKTNNTTTTNTTSDHLQSNL